MRTSEYRANQELKATPRWTERPARKPGVKLTTVLGVMVVLAMVAAVGSEVLPWMMN